MAGANKRINDKNRPKPPLSKQELNALVEFHDVQAKWHTRNGRHQPASHHRDRAEELQRLLVNWPWLR